MTARLRLVAGQGGPTVSDLHCSGALAFRPTEWGVWMVGTEAHPIGGDRILARLAVGPGCEAKVRSVSASVARRGAGSSVVAVVVRVAEAGVLDWDPEPGVAAEGADHRSDARIRLGSGARLRWRDEWVLGRVAEEPGSWASRIQIVYEDRPLVVSELATGPEAPGWGSSAVLAGARAVSSLVVVDSSRTFETGRASCGTAVGTRLPLVGPGMQITAWGEDLTDCRKVVDQLA